MFRPISSGFLAVSFREKKAFRFDHSFLGIYLDAGFQRWNHRVFFGPETVGKWFPILRSICSQVGCFNQQLYDGHCLKWVKRTNAQ